MNQPEYLQTWIESTLKSVRRYGIVFIPLGSGHDRIRSSCLDSIEASMTVQEYFDNGLAIFENQKTIALRDFEVFCSDTAFSINELRSRVHRDCDDGYKFIFFSRCPKSCYPDVPGSSILIDAKIVVPPMVTNSDEHYPEGVRYEYPATEGSVSDPTREELSLILDELGIDVISDLDRVVYESMLPRDEILADLHPRATEGLWGAGIVRATDTGYEWNFPRSHGELRLALADSVSRLRTAPDAVSEAFALVWGIERMVRFSMRTRAVAVAGRPSWQTEAVDQGLADEVMKRATGDAYPAAKSIRELRDPFEWLTLSELLDLRKSKTATYGDLGLEEHVWKSFGIEVPPIRNRLSHMRLPQASDLNKLKKWHTALTRKLTV